MEEEKDHCNPDHLGLHDLRNEVKFWKEKYVESKEKSLA
jgi:hypothetical protein